MEKFLRGPALTDAVRDHIKQHILSNNLKEGDPLPTEAQFAQNLGVGRSSVREAVKALQSLGIVEMRPGRGLFVRAYNLDSIFENFSFGMRFDQNSLKEWLQIRTWLESAIMETSIKSITPEAIREMEMILSEWEECLRTNRPHIDLDERFHQALYRGLGNKILIKFLGVYWIVLRNLETLSHLTPSQAEKENTLEEHRQILLAIKEGDVQRAIHFLQSGFHTLETRIEHIQAEHTTAEKTI